MQELAPVSLGEVACPLKVRSAQYRTKSVKSGLPRQYHRHTLSEMFCPLGGVSFQLPFCRKSSVVRHGRNGDIE